MKKGLCVIALAALLLGAAVPAHAGAEGTEAALPACETGGRILYGSYEQDGLEENGAEPIEWIVLDAKDGSALLLSRYELAARPFHRDWDGGVEWAACDLRAWLGRFSRRRSARRRRRASSSRKTRTEETRRSA